MFCSKLERLPYVSFQSNTRSNLESMMCKEEQNDIILKSVIKYSLFFFARNFIGNYVISSNNTEEVVTTGSIVPKVE